MKKSKSSINHDVMKKIASGHRGSVIPGNVLGSIGVNSDLIEVMLKASDKMVSQAQRTVNLKCA